MTFVFHYIKVQLIIYHMQSPDLISMLCQLTFYYSFSLIIYFSSLLNIEATLYLDKFLDVTQLAADLLSDPPLIVDVAHPPVKTRVIAHLGALIEMMMHHAEHIFQFL